MSDNSLVQLNDVGLAYRPLRTDRSIFRPSTLRSARYEIWALRNINLDVQSGSRVGIIGANGAGKTTLLRVIAGILIPTVGSAMVGVSVQSLIDAGFGLSTPLSGRSNARILGFVRGITGKQLDEFVSAVKDEFGYPEAFDRPVSTYSTGMLTRLVFAACTVLPPRALILDELLSAGDESFQAQATAKFRRYIDEASCIVLASHSMHVIQDVCSSALWLHEGEIVEYGQPQQVCAAYVAFSRTRLGRTPA